MSNFNFNAQSTGGFAGQEQVSNDFGQFTDDSFSDLDMNNFDESALRDMSMNEVFDTGAMQGSQMSAQMPTQIPTQTQMPQQALMPTTTPATQPLWHPEIGWFIPTAPPPSMPATQNMRQMPSYAMLQAGYTTMPAPQANMALQQVSGFYGFAPQPVYPVQQSIEQMQHSIARLEFQANNKTEQPRRNNKRSQTLGPQSYLDDNHGKEPPSKRPRKAKANAPIVIDSDDDDEYVDNAGPSHAERLKPGSIYQTCVCQPTGHSTKPNRIPRPRNAFIIYRTSNSKKIARELKARGKNGGVLNQKVSQYAGEMWKAEPEAVKAEYRERARQEAEKHKRDYPNYVYRPRRRGGDMKEQEGFGGPWCTCGAYVRNLAKYEGRPIPGVFEVPRHSKGSMSPETQTQEQRVGQAEQSSLFEPEQQQRTVRWNEAEELQRLQAQTDAHHAQQQQQSFDFGTFEDSNSTPPLRSSRTRSGVAYNTTNTIETPKQEDFANLLAPLQQQANNAAPTPAPAPASPERERRRPTPINTPFNSPPAHNTRRRSRQQSAIDFGDLPTHFSSGELDDDLFGKNGMFNDTEFNADVDFDSFLQSSPSRRRSSNANAAGSASRRVSVKFESQSPKRSLRRSPRHAGQGQRSPRSNAIKPRRSARRSG